MTKRVALLAALVVLGSVACAVAAGPIPKIVKAKPFNPGLATIDLAGGANLAQAAAAIDGAIAQVEKETADQKKIVASFAQATKKAQEEKAAAEANKAANEKAKSDNEAALKGLEALPQTDPIKAAIDATKAEIASCVAEIAKADEGLKKAEAKIAFLLALKSRAEENLKILQSVLESLKKAAAELPKVSLPTPPPIVKGLFPKMMVRPLRKL